MNAVERTAHIRRPQNGLRLGNWSLKCDCGWEGLACATDGPRVRSNTEIEQDLEKQFVDHLPAKERRLYILVDQRQVEVPENPEDPDSKLVMVGTGNFIMPIGTPCLLTKHRTHKGVHWASYLVPDTGEAGELPVGEVRTADSRVFRVNSPA